MMFIMAGKIAGIHWLFNTPSHAAELTAGYINVRNIYFFQKITIGLFIHFVSEFSGTRAIRFQSLSRVGADLC